jgi:hypothetical protein
LRHDGQSFIFGDQCVSAHGKSCYPQPASVAIRHLAGFSFQRFSFQLFPPPPHAESCRNFVLTSIRFSGERPMHFLETTTLPPAVWRQFAAT